MWYDTHCHLDFPAFKGHQGTLLEQLKQQGCQGVLVPGVSLENWPSVIALKQTAPDFLHIALGLHPYFIEQHAVEDLDRLEEKLHTHRGMISAVGEVGVDLYSEDLHRAQQFMYFSEQITLAKQYQLPLILHSRKSHDQVLKRLRQTRFDQGGIVHGFSGSLQQAQQFIELGFVIGLGGALTHDRAKAMHRLVASLKDNQFVLETDAPDMRPAFALDKFNTPLHIPQVAQHIALLRGQTRDHIYAVSSANFERVVLKVT